MAQTDRRTGLVGYSGMKIPVRVATTAAITLSGEQTIDGVACVTGDRVLVKDQASSIDNGIYEVDTGDWNRSADCDGPYDLVQGSVLYANAGSTNTGFWYCTSADDIDIGTDNITWARASSVLAAVSPFMQTVLDDTTAAAARGTLDTAQLTESMTEDTAPDKIADFLSAYDASAAAEKKLRLVTAVARAMPWGQGLLINGKIVPSVAANALTLAVKGDDGNDPSATNPVYALFRKASLTDAGFDVIAITAALSVVVSSGSTLGHASNIAQHVFVYLINNAGAAEVAVSNLPPDYPGTFGKARLVSTTAEGGVGGADSATGVYSTTARSNVSWSCVAKILTTQTTAGTWLTAITQIDQAPFVIPINTFICSQGAAQTIASATWTKVRIDTEELDGDNIFDAATNYRAQPNVAGPFSLDMTFVFDSFASGQRILLDVYKNGASYAWYSMANPATNGQTGLVNNPVLLANGTTDYFEMYVYQDTGGNKDSSVSEVRFAGHRIAGSNS